MNEQDVVAGDGVGERGWDPTEIKVPDINVPNNPGDQGNGKNEEGYTERNRNMQVFDEGIDALHVCFRKQCEVKMVSTADENGLFRANVKLL
jgi:hypothetical protein